MAVVGGARCSSLVLVGVGSAAVRIAARRDFFDRCVVADYDLGRAERALAALDDARFHRRPGRRVLRRRRSTALCREHGITHVLNAVDPRFVMPIFDGAFAAGCRLPGHGHVAVAAAPDAARTRSAA